MSTTAIINRALSNIRTELEFITESEVITYELCKKILEIIPRSYAKDMEPWGLEKLNINNSNSVPSYGSNYFHDDPFDQDESGEAEFEFKNTPAKMKVVNVDVGSDLRASRLERSAPITPPSQISHHVLGALSPGAAAVVQHKSPIGYCKVLNDYIAERQEDISISKGEKIAIVEQLSGDWYVGYKKNGSDTDMGVFPSGYVMLITEEQYLRSESVSPTIGSTSTPVPQTTFDPAILQNTGIIENTSNSEVKERRPLTPDPSPSIHQKEIFPLDSPIGKNSPINGKSSPPRPSENPESLSRGVSPLPNNNPKNLQRSTPPTSRNRAISINSQQMEIKKVPGFHMVQTPSPAAKIAQPEQPVFVSPDQPLQDHQSSEKRLSQYMNQSHVQPFSGQQMRQYAEPTPPKKKESHFKLFGKK
ncbi:hypothetical protein CLIB1423_02S06458 [[Candida] railenensis]|uniref:SH3 domain-containing protein n=1 Tax=[Candida] railenensis TaxID=45579 RepID=A0A9P0QLX9_9ASCO|nr:hypothetical protein CLIB1423_02S06458 [[Candida] railenensis]